MSQKERQSAVFGICRRTVEVYCAMDQKLLTGEVIQSAGITKAQFLALQLLDGRGRMTATEFSEALGIAKSNATPLVDRLVHEGYVMREHGETDRRKVYLNITDQGRDVLRAISDGILADASLWLPQADDKKLAELLKTLDKLGDILKS